MFRKRKTVAPDFRMPAPYDPVHGGDHTLYGPYKPYARFVLREELTHTTEEAEATLTTTHMWGTGLYHCPEVIAHVHNLLTGKAGVYQHSGEIGDIGFAVWDQANHWRIVYMLVSSLREFCLAEDHPGRGIAFDVYKGVWDPDQDKWTYPDTVTTYKAIDWRYDVPYPDEGSKGLFTPRVSTTHGVIYECVSLDCDTPGTCDD